MLFSSNIIEACSLFLNICIYTVNEELVLCILDFTGQCFDSYSDVYWGKETNINLSKKLIHSGTSIPWNNVQQ